MSSKANILAAWLADMGLFVIDCFTTAVAAFWLTMVVLFSVAVFLLAFALCLPVAVLVYVLRSL